ncbi:MAG: hypothetical protein IJJ33_17480, partial [Victivallales bacterium]|nr:hypothetical protein [Victivallales bacterium]
ALMAEAVKGHCQFAAKLQVACSHECATVPYIPAPGLLYRKYREMRSLGVQHVLQCWYFGNYPGLMNEAAGKLAYEDFSTSEEDFLVSLAKPTWGEDWPQVVQAWRHFADGYSHYPLDIQFQYYGPMHDGPVWPLHLRRAMLPLTRSWKPETFPSGDALGESMQHFRLNELAELTGQMQREWRQGLLELQKAHREGHELEYTLAEALDIQFRSGHNILRFYTLRNALFDTPPESGVLLKEMKRIVLEEIANSTRLAELCRQDARLGYHSEAEVYKYFPAKLQWRARQLQSLLDTDFASAESLLDNPHALRTFLLGDLSPAVPGKTYGANGIRWSFECNAESLVFHLDFESAGQNPESAHLFFMDEKGENPPPFPIQIFRKDSQPTATGWHADYTLSRLRLNQASCFWFGVEKVENRPGFKNIHTNDKPGQFIHEARLNLDYFGPDKLTLLICQA